MPTDEEIESILAGIDEVAVVTPVTKLKKLGQAKDADVEEFVRSTLDSYRGIVNSSSHWSLSLVAILNRIAYKPEPRLCANRDLLPARGSPAAINIVQKHLTNLMLEDIREKVSSYVANIYDPDSVLTMVDEDGNMVEGAIFIGEHEITAVAEIELPASSSQESWGSW